MPNQKKVNILTLTFESLFFILSSISLYYFTAILCNEVGSDFRGLPRMLPAVVLLLLPLYSLFVIHLASRPRNEKKAYSTLIVNGAILSVISLILVIYVCIQIGIGKVYSSPVEGYPSPLFPIDLVIGCILFAFLGLALFLLGKRLKKREMLLWAVVPSNKKLPTRIVLSIFNSLLIILSGYFLGALIISLGSFDHSFNHVFGVITISLLMLFLSCPLFFYEWRRFFRNEALNRKSQGKESLIFLSTGLLLDVLFLVALCLDPQFVIETTMSYFSFDYMISLAAAPYLLLILSLVPSFIGFVDYLVHKTNNH